jgi:D-amino-acid dehydrogenase
MEEGLRVAGTVEIGLNNKKINNSRVNWIKKNTFETFNFTEDPESIWLGHRPTLPDSLPVIGCSKKNKNILYNFGHQHLGLTLGAISADIIIDILQKKTLNNTLDSIKPTRFS